MHSEFGSKWFDCWKMKKDESFVKIVKLQKYSYIDRIEDVEKKLKRVGFAWYFRFIILFFSVFYYIYIYKHKKHYLMWFDVQE